MDPKKANARIAINWAINAIAAMQPLLQTLIQLVTRADGMASRRLSPMIGALMK
jgi:hypothetical protein